MNRKTERLKALALVLHQLDTGRRMAVPPGRHRHDSRLPRHLLRAADRKGVVPIGLADGRTNDRPIMGLLVLYFVFLAVEALSFSGEARIFPLAVSVPGAVLSLIAVLQARTGAARPGSSETANTLPHPPAEGVERGESGEGAEATAGLLGRRRAIVSYFLPLGYVGLAALIGYLPATAVVVIAGAYFLGFRDGKVMIIASIALTVVVWVTFQVLLGVSLPGGLVGSGYR